MVIVDVIDLIKSIYVESVETLMRWRVQSLVYQTAGCQHSMGETAAVPYSYKDGKSEVT